MYSSNICARKQLADLLCARCRESFNLHIEANSVRARERWRVRQTDVAMNVWKNDGRSVLQFYLYNSITRFKPFTYL